MAQSNLDGEVPWFFISHVVKCTQTVPFFRFLIYSIAKKPQQKKNTLINASVKVIHKRIVFVVTAKKNNKEINYK